MVGVGREKIGIIDYKFISILCVLNSFIRIGKLGYNIVYLLIYVYYIKSSFKLIGRY